MEQQLLIAVDQEGEVLRPETRETCHHGAGILHLAFSIYLFDARGRLLLQRRSADKHLWPLCWSNSCCSHPRWGEAIDAAAARRLDEELGVQAPLRPLFTFEYHAQFNAQGAERERCTVYIGRADRVGDVDAAEVADWQFVAADELDRHLGREPDAYTPWLRLAWQQLRADHWPAVTALSARHPA